MSTIERPCPPIANHVLFRTVAEEMPAGWNWDLRQRAEQMLLAALAEAGYPTTPTRAADGSLNFDWSIPPAVADKARRLVMEAIGARYSIKGRGR